MLTRDFALLFVLALPGFAAERTSTVDRGLPQANLNNMSGDFRSNVRWGWGDHGFLGDDFTIGNPGEQWIIDSIRTWTVPGTAEADPERLGEFYQDVRLYLGRHGGGLTPVATALLFPGADETSDERIAVSDATRAGALPYDDFGARLRIWQVEFKDLNMVLDGGVKYNFGVLGMGRPIPGGDGAGYPWFNYAANAPLSAARQDGADGVMLLFNSGGKFQRVFNASDSGWDKPADISVQVFAHRVYGRPSVLRAIR